MSEWVRQCNQCTHYVNVDASGMVLPYFSCNAWDCHFEPKDKRKVGAKQTKLRTLILEKFGSIRKFAPAVGMTESMVSHILNGRKKLFADNAKNFATVLGVFEETIYDYLNKEDNK